MNKTSVFFILVTIFALTSISAAEINTKLPEWIKGTWKSNWNLTKRHIDKDCNIKRKQVKIYKKLMGKIKITYKHNSIDLFTPSFTVGKETIEDTTSSKNFKILYSNDDQLVLFNNDELFGESASIITKVDESTYWIYISNGILNIHMREYFTKIEKPLDKTSPKGSEII